MRSSSVQIFHALLGGGRRLRRWWSEDFRGRREYGGDEVMANWLPMALTGAPRAWLLNLPGSTVASWEELRGLFSARYAALVHHAVAALLGGSQAPPSDRHIKPFLRQIGAASKRSGAPLGCA